MVADRSRQGWRSPTIAAPRPVARRSGRSGCSGSSARKSRGCPAVRLLVPPQGGWNPGSRWRRERIAQLRSGKWAVGKSITSPPAEPGSGSDRQGSAMAVTQVPGEGCPSTLPGMGLPPPRRDDTLGATTATSTARAMPPWKAQQRGWRAPLCGVEPVELQACHGQDHPPHALAQRRSPLSLPTTPRSSYR